MTEQSKLSLGRMFYWQGVAFLTAGIWGYLGLDWWVTVGAGIANGLAGAIVFGMTDVSKTNTE